MVTLHPPQLRAIDDEGPRHATWLELFYDLVFVIAIGAVSHRLAAHTSLRDILVDLLFFVPVWWAWVGHTIYSNRFDVDDLFYRILTFMQMLGALGMALTMQDALEGSARAFAVSYICVRLILLLLYAHAWWHEPQARRIAGFYILVFGTGAALWIVSLFFSSPVFLAFWAAGMLFDMIMPWFARPLLSTAQLDARHLPVRFGLFTIIMLGEQVLAIVRSLEGTVWTDATAMGSVFAFLIAAATWWFYFEYLNVWQDSHCLRGGQPFIYGHLTLSIGMLLASVGLEHMVAGGEPMPPQAGWMLSIGTILWLLSLVPLDYATSHCRESQQVPWPPVSAAICIIILRMFDMFTSLATLVAFAAILLIHVVIEEWRFHRKGVH